VETLSGDVRAASGKPHTSTAPTYFPLLNDLRGLGEEGCCIHAILSTRDVDRAPQKVPGRTRRPVPTGLSHRTRPVRERSCSRRTVPWVPCPLVRGNTHRSGLWSIAAPGRISTRAVIPIRRSPVMPDVSGTRQKERREQHHE
jgi:hypothetical protein